MIKSSGVGLRPPTTLARPTRIRIRKQKKGTPFERPDRSTLVNDCDTWRLLSRILYLRYPPRPHPRSFPGPRHPPPALPLPRPPRSSLRPPPLRPTHPLHSPIWVPLPFHHALHLLLPPHTALLLYRRTDMPIPSPLPRVATLLQHPRLPHRQHV